MGLGDALIGTWRLQSREDRLESGELREEPTLGPDPLGLLVYDRAGNFAAQFMKRERPALVASEVPATVTTESDTGGTAASATLASNNSTAVGGYDAYFGTYTVDDATNLVTQRLVAALTPTDVGNVVTREMHVVDDELVIRVAMTAADGVPVVRTLRWSREA
jgi:Lipocalin-like domain